MKQIILLGLLSIASAGVYQITLTRHDSRMIKYLREGGFLALNHVSSKSIKLEKMRRILERMIAKFYITFILRHLELLSPI